jgi:hypothetical protein
MSKPKKRTKQPRVRLVGLYFGPREYAVFLKRVKALAKDFNTDNVTSTVLEAVKRVRHPAVSVSQSLKETVASAGPEERAQLIAEQQELERLAAERRDRAEEVFALLAEQASDGQIRRMLRERWGIVDRDAVRRETHRAVEQNVEKRKREDRLGVEGQIAQLEAICLRLNTRIVALEADGQSSLRVYKMALRARQLLAYISSPDY